MHDSIMGGGFTATGAARSQRGRFLNTILVTDAISDRSTAEPFGSVRSRAQSVVRSLLDASSVDIRALASFRVALSLILLCDLWWRAQDLRFFYSDEGALLRAEAMSLGSQWIVSLFFLNGTWQFQAVLFLLYAAVLVALLVGYRTQMMAVLTWLFVMSIQRRNPQILQGGDNLVRCLAFWAMFVPLGAAWSVDAMRSGRRAIGQKVISLPALFIQLQMVGLYFFSSLLKSGAAWHEAHSAVYYALSVDPLTTPVGRALLPYRGLLSVLTQATMILEKYCGFLAFIPARNPMFRILTTGLFWSFHIALLITMNLGPFPFICLAGWLLFLPSQFWNKISGSSQPSVDWASRRYRDDSSKVFRFTRDLAVTCFFVTTVLWNIRTLDFERGQKYLPVTYNYLLELVGLDQNWGMFAPYPMNWDGWYQIVGRTVSGRAVNLSPGANAEDPITDERPERIDRMYSTERWRKYMMFLAERNSAPWRGAYMRALVASWAAAHPNDVLQNVEMYFWFELTLDEGSSPVEKQHLWHYER
ncbi:MAG: HTTM domain-containing protein [Bdellovibrionota bacterium]